MGHLLVCAYCISSWICDTLAARPGCQSPIPFLSQCMCACRLRPIDVKFMKELHELVNIIPVIAKADTLTPNELRSLKQRVSNWRRWHSTPALCQTNSGAEEYCH